MMLEMKRVVLLLSVVLLTCAAPLHQDNELSSSQESQVTSRVTRVWGTPGSDIIITAPEGFGKPNKNGRSTVTVSLRDENTNVSIDVVSFIFSVSTEDMSNAKLGESNGGFSDEAMQDNGAGPGKTEEKNNSDNDEEPSEEGLDPTAGPEVLTSDEGLDKSQEETPDLRDDKSEDQKHSTSSESYIRVNSEGSDPDHPKVFETTTTSEISSLQEDSNESDSRSEHQKTKVHTDQSESAEPSVIHYLPGQLTSLSSDLASTLTHQETTSTEANVQGTEPILGPFQTALPLSSSSEEKTDDKWKNSISDPSPSKTASLISGPESMVHTEVVKKTEAPLTPFFSGSDLYPEYVNDEWQYDPRYYDPYRNHPGYAAGYDPYGGGYDPYGAGYDPYGAGYDPYQAGYDPYGESYDPYGAGYDPYGAGYDPYGERHDPYQEGYDNHDPYHETESKDTRYDEEQETTPAYSVEENESRPTETSSNQDNSHSEEQHQSPSISPSSTPVSHTEGSDKVDFAQSLPSEEPSNSSSIETSREMGLEPSKGPNDSNTLPDSAVSNSEEDTKISSEESVETSNSEQESQNPTDQTGNQGTPDPAVHMSVVQVSHATQKMHNAEEPHSQSPVDLIPTFSSEEDDPLVNTIGRIMDFAFNGGSNEQGSPVGKNPDSTPSDNTISENNQNDKSFSDESTRDSPGVSADVTGESVDLATQIPAFGSEPVPSSDVSNEDASSENKTPNPSTNPDVTTQSNGGLDNSAESNANANTANDSEESQESQIFTPSAVFPVASQPSREQNNENNSNEENTQESKSNQGIISQFPLDTPTKIIAKNLWTSFLQALKVPIPNQSRQSVQKIFQRPQNTRRFHQRFNRRQKSDSSEERK